VKKSVLFLLCGAVMASAALAVPASASAEDGVMTPAFVVILDGAAPTALPDLDIAIINLGYDSAPSAESPRITPAAMTRAIPDSDAGVRSPLSCQPGGVSYEGFEVPTAEGVPKST
jgi:hypothetical protein